MSEIFETIATLLDSTMREIGEFAAKKDLAAVSSLTRRATELETLKRTFLDIQDRLRVMQFTPNEEKSETASEKMLRELPTEVTQGMINQNVLTLTEHFNRGSLRAGEVVTIEAKPSGERFRTTVIASGKKLRERGSIGRFYKDAEVRPGDFVVLKEVSQGHWLLEKAPAGRFLGRKNIRDDSGTRVFVNAPRSMSNSTAISA